MRSVVEEDVRQLLVKLAGMPAEDRGWAIARFTSMLRKQPEATIELFADVARHRMESSAAAQGASWDGEVVEQVYQSILYAKASK